MMLTEEAPLPTD